MEKLKNLKLLTIFKRFFICFSVVNLLIIGSVFVKPEANYVYADTNIDDSNSKSIFVNLAFMVMGALGIQTVRSVTGLGNDFANSLGDLYDNWMATTSLTTQAVTALLSAHVHVTKQNQLSLAAPIYNKIVDFITYLRNVPKIFTPATDPFFTYDQPGSYVILPVATLLATYPQDNYGNNFKTYYQGSSDAVRFVCFYRNAATTNVAIYAVSMVAGTSYIYNRTNNGNPNITDQVNNLTSTRIVNGITYYYKGLGITTLADYISNIQVMPYDSTPIIVGGALEYLAIYYAFGVGAVGGTDGTIGLPDPITRNRDTPFPGIADDDSVPLSVPGDFANDWPLDDDTDIPLAIPRAIPWVYDIPIDTPIDTPIDIPFFFDPNSPGVPIPPGLIDLPDDWYNIPLIVSPECQSLSACLLSGVETVSSNLQSFYNIHPDVAAFTSLSIGIGFALLVLGVIF